MTHLTAIAGEGGSSLPERQAVLVPKLSSAWAGAKSLSVGLRQLKLSLKNERKGRLERVAISCDKICSRLLARMAALGGSPIPAIGDERYDLQAEPSPALAQLASEARFNAAKSRAMANLARDYRDQSAAWVFELSAAELLDVAADLDSVISWITTEESTPKTKRSKRTSNQ